MLFDDEGDVLKDVDPQEFVGANLFLFAHHVAVSYTHLRCKIE